MISDKHGLRRCECWRDFALLTLHLYLEVTVHIHVECLLVVSMRSFSLIQLSVIFISTILEVVGQKSKIGENVCTIFKFGVSRESFLFIV